MLVLLGWEDLEDERILGITEICFFCEVEEKAKHLGKGTQGR